MAEYKRLIERTYDMKVKPKGFKVEELVLGKVLGEEMRKDGKISPKGEGTYKDKEVGKNRAYKLEHPTEDKTQEEIIRIWNAINLKKYFP